MVVLNGVDELGRDPGTVSCTPYAAFDNIAHTKFAADVPDLEVLSLKDERRVARDHKERSVLGQLG